MRKANDKSIKEAIEQMMQVYKIKRKFEETGIIAHWPNIVGKAVASRTKEIFVLDKKLFLRIESSVIKNELMVVRNQIIERINNEADTVLIEEVIFL